MYSCINVRELRAGNACGFFFTTAVEAEEAICIPLAGGGLSCEDRKFNTRMHACCMVSICN